MNASNFTDEEMALGQLYRWIEQRANYLRKQKTGSVSILADDTEPAGDDGKKQSTTNKEILPNVK